MNRKSVESKLIKRIRTIEGHLKKVESMVSDPQEVCQNILEQTYAIECALKSLDKEIVINHFQKCLCDDDHKCERHDKAIRDIIQILEKRS